MVPGIFVGFFFSFGSFVLRILMQMSFVIIISWKVRGLVVFVICWYKMPKL